VSPGALSIRMLPAILVAVGLLAGSLSPTAGAQDQAGNASMASQDQAANAAGDTIRPEADPFRPPIGGAWEPVVSIGQPPRWRPFLGLAYGLDRTLPGEGAGGTVSLGMARDLFSPVYGALGVSGQLYAGQRAEEFDGGVRLELESPALFLHLGGDWNARSRRTDLLLGISAPPLRGGLFGRGGEVRLDYLPTRDHSFQVGITLPLRQPLAGRTRPGQVDVELPRPPRRALDPAPLSPPVKEAMEEVREAMDWMVAVGNFFWLTENESLGYRATVEEWREILGGFRQELDAREDEIWDGASHEGKVEAYHSALDRAFGRAMGADDPDGAEALGRPLADQARRMALEEVVLPYNRTIGQYKQPDRLGGLTARARARWTAWADLDPSVRGRAGPARGVLDAWIRELEGLHHGVSELARDSRMHWLPLALVLRPEEHRTAGQIDDLIRLALGRGFEDGNSVLTVNAPQFQLELLRTIHETETYHVLWIHDIRGRNGEGRPDRVAIELVTEGYLRALIHAVRDYDESGRLPVFIILLDQHFYELNDGRVWMDLLENPLSHQVSLPPGHEESEVRIRMLQDSLDAAVRNSRRLSAERGAFGPGWIDQVVKVHVNITNPSDFSFRSRRLLGPPIGADNLLRDHRKVVIRDVFEDDPASGEAILAGVGVGEHYASPTWDDRAIIIQGPAAAQAVVAAREVLERNQLGGARLPAPLRYRPRAPDYEETVTRLRDEGANARVLQVHNRTGWGVKDATFVQMLLYDLAPPGTVLYVPDSLWTSFQWMAQLVSAALRGCHVYVVAPALTNAPSAGFPQMSAMQELLTRLVIVEEVFGDRIREGGGDLRVGLFDREIPLDDLEGLVAEMGRALDDHPFLAELLPFSPGARDLLESTSAPTLEGSREGAGPFGVTSTERPPQLHRKTQWIVDREILRGLASSPAMPELATRALDILSEGAVTPPEAGALIGQDRFAMSREMADIVRELIPPGEEPVLYFATGSMNKNVRSMALDGEAMAVVGGPWALHTFFDLVVLSAGVTWVDSLEQVEELLPPFSTFQRRIGRWLHRVL
jgi:phosphatidylserine/phosphatidylglycerophosphate/cardiolipin synthase-like enzyme